MAESMRRGKTAAAGAIIYKKAQLRSHYFIAAGPGSPNGFLYELAADEVAEGGAQYNAHYPPPAFDAKVTGNKQQQEQVQGHPKQGLPHVG